MKLVGFLRGLVYPNCGLLGEMAFIVALNFLAGDFYVQVPQVPLNGLA
jgi:hypothetical protein